MIPRLLDVPQVRAAHDAHEKAVADLASARMDRVQAERGLNLPEGVGGEDLARRLVDSGCGPDEAVRLAHLRKRERELDQSATMARGELARATVAARPVLAARVRAEVFNPALRTAALKALDAIGAVFEVSRLASEIEAAGLHGTALPLPFGGAIGCDPSNPSDAADLAGLLVRSGVVSEQEVRAAVPGLIG